MGQFITPPTLPTDVYCRRILIPNSPEWIGTVTGALLPLIYSSEWVQTTGISPEDAASRALEMFNLYVNSGNDGECGDMACCGDQVILHRYNPETGRPEISKDGGTTWTTDPSDPQNQIPLYPPIVTTTSGKTKCDAATNASEHANELIDAIAGQLSTAGDIFALTVGIAEAILALVLVLVSAGTLTPIVTAVATAIWAAGSAAFALGHDAYVAYWTTDKKDAILCQLYCHIGENGQFTEAQYQAVRAGIKAQLPASPALDIFMTSLNAGGAIGLSQMASYGNAAEADCSSCGCGCPTIYSWIDGNSTLSLDTDCVGHSLAGIADGGNYKLYLGAITSPPSFPTTDGFGYGAHTLISGTIETNGYYRLDGTVGYDFGAIPSKIAAVFFESNAPFALDIQFLPA